MQIVIDIPKEIVEWINDYFDIIKVLNGEKTATIVDAIKNGTPIPKGHGKLIDADKLRNTILKDTGISLTEYYLTKEYSYIEDALTIIEADTEESEECKYKRLKKDCDGDWDYYCMKSGNCSYQPKMTREEAIFCEKSYMGETNCTDCKYYGTETCLSRESHRMAIKALGQESCEDAISRKAVLDKKELVELEDGQSFYCISPENVEALLPVTPQPKTGHWVEENINEWGCKVFCSECGCPPPFEYISNGDVYSASGYGVINKTKFCPNCGARMFEQLESEDNNDNNKR